MNWKDYEKEIYSHFRAQFPNAEISHNVKVKGRYSKVDRQIDILIEDYIAGNRIRIVIDGKYFSKKIDVKDVEMFIGMLNDCEANKGLLITQKGYSEAAIYRAYHDPIDIELDIYNFKSLSEFQGFTSIEFNDGHGVIINAPFGWIVDQTSRENVLATLYQRGLTLELAQKSNEWMYVSIKSKSVGIQNIKQLIDFQNLNVIKHFPNAKIKSLPTIKRDDVNIELRSIEVDGYPTIEYNGFVEFEEFIFFCVMFTPELVKKRNIRKLESVMQQILNFQIVVDSFDWSIETNKKGTMMFLDIIYIKSTNDIEEYLTITVAKDYSEDRPEFISVIVPNNIVKEKGICMSFSKTKLNEEQYWDIEKMDTIYKLNFESCNDQFYTSRMMGGYIIDPILMEEIDILQKLLHFDHVYFNFEYSDGSNKSVAVPLFSFKKQYNLI